MAFSSNRIFYNRFGPGIIGTLVPFWEEILKTGLAWLLKGSIVGSHGVFGAVEFLWDLFQPGKGHLKPALAGFLSHLLLGILTQWIYQITGLLPGAILAAGIVHACWNWLMLSRGEQYS
ncbi:MAG: hypothetical protein GX262_02245 [Clostridia bacterium]|nr:hypothetical protein [Clostridia bacterium]